MIFKHNKKATPPPTYTVTFTLAEAAMFEEALAFTLAECQHLAVKNKLSHGAHFTETELAALHFFIEFLGRHDLAAMKFLLDHPEERRAYHAENGKQDNALHR